MQTPNKHHYFVLDALRGIAAVFVVIWHTSSYWGSMPIQHAYLAVDIFFVLSGFVIASAYREKLTSQALSLTGFLVTRVVRLYPMYGLGLLLGLIAYSLGAFEITQPLPLELLCAIFMLPAGMSASGQTLFVFNLPSWSLFYELIANVAVAFIYRFRLHRLLPAMLLGLGTGLTAITLYKGDIDIGAFGGYKNLIIATTRSLFGILMGLWLQQIHKHHNLNIPTSFGWVALSALIVILSLPTLGELDVWVDVVAIIIIIPSCVFLLANFRPQLSSGALKSAKFLGDISYPLYAIHYPLMLIGLALWPTTIANAKNLSGIILLGFLLAASFTLFKWFETPARRWLAARTHILRR